MCAVRERWAKQEAGTFKVRIRSGNAPEHYARESIYPTFRCLAAGFAGSLAFSLTVPLPAIGNSISRWPAARFFGFFAFSLGCSTAFAASVARLRFSASIKLTTFGAGAAMRSVGTDMPALLR